MAEVTTAATQNLSSLPTAIASTTDPIPALSTKPPTEAPIVEVSRLLKPASPRKRRRSSASPSAQTTDRTLRKSSVPISPKFGLPSQAIPPPLTAASEMAEQKRRRIETEKEKSQQLPQTSPNPKRKAVEALLGIQANGISRPSDAPSTPANTLSEPIAAITPAISIPQNPQDSGSIQTSPVSVSSSGTRESNGLPSMTANGPQVVASPGHMGEEDGQDGGIKNAPPQHDTEDTPSNKAFSYPGPLLNAQIDSRRGMSLPGSGLVRDHSRSPSSNKKHKCPYCETEFTRHHNLKSHLLTHSHEKPYLCQTCDSRFRRLHDLKRHTKLHTGERPHICPKCKRSFARGDALARHNKGQGGCAGRRSSVGSFGGDTPGGDESMEGMVYTNEASHEPENMDEDSDGPEDRGASVPSIRRHDAPPSQPYRAETQSAYQRQPSTYPPVAARAPMGGTLQPPATSQHGSSTSTSPGTQPSPLSSYPPATSFPPSSVFAPQQPMTESPQPLSAGDPRNRSPSLSTQLSAHNYGRRPHARSSPPPLPLPPPPPAHSNAPQLPSLPGLTPPDPRYTLHSTPSGPHIPGGPLPHPQQQSGSYPGIGLSSAGGFHSSASNSLSSHGTTAHGSGDRVTLQSTLEERMWVMVKDLEAKVDSLQDKEHNLQDKVGSLQEEVRGLRAQLQQQQPPHQA